MLLDFESLQHFSWNIDNNWMVKLASVRIRDADVPLAQHLAYEQLKPLKTSDVHRVNAKVSVTAEAVPLKDASQEADTDTSLSKHFCDAALCTFK